MTMNPYEIGDMVNYNGKKCKVVSAWNDGDLALLEVDGGERVRGFINHRKVKKWEEPVVSNSLGVIAKGILGVKLKMPHGVKLNETEANYIIDGWESEKTVVKTKQKDLASVAEKIERHIAKTGNDIAPAMKDLKEAKKRYLEVKSPLAKRKWARNVVVRTAYYEQLRNSHQTLNATVSRVKDAVDDAQYVYKTLESRIAEARIYRELHGGLTLVGKSLVEAKQKHMVPEIEYQNLEVTMESIEHMAGDMDDTKALEEADKIVNDKSRWATK